jgi:hypothetical protein
VILTAASSGTNDSSTWNFIGTKAPALFGELSGLSKDKHSWGFTNSPIHLTLSRSMSVESVWTIWHSPVEAETSLRRGRSGCPNSVSTMVESSTPATALGFLVVTQTTSPWNSSLPPFRSLAGSAARAAQWGDANGSAKTRTGNVEAMRVLRVTRSSARRSRTQAINQMRSLISTAPDELRAELRDRSIFEIFVLASAYRHTARTDVTGVTKLTLRSLARRALSREEQVKDIDRLLKTLVAETIPELHAIYGVGTDVASALLVAAGDNPERLKNEVIFAKLCGVAPLDAPSGKNERHRLNHRRGPARPTRLSGTSCSPGWSTTPGPSTTSSDE